MKDFLKFTLATIVGLLITGAIVTVLGIVTLLGFAATADTETAVKENSVFVLDLKGECFGTEFRQSVRITVWRQHHNQRTGRHRCFHQKSKRKPEYQRSSASMPADLPVRRPLCKKSAVHLPISRRAVNSLSPMATVIRKAPTTWPVLPTT